MATHNGEIAILSAIICTFNRARSLGVALSHILTCDFPPACEIEVIVIDNNSTDDTRAVVQAYASSAVITIKYMFERVQGMGNALNTGIAHARGDVLCFIDDDCIPDREFFSAVKQQFESRHYSGVMGGRVELWDHADLPLTIKTECYEQRLPLDTTPVGFTHGCNMAVHRGVFQAIGGFDRRLGPGSVVGSATDVDFFYRARCHGFDVIYCPSILVYHNHGRKTLEDANKLITRYHIGRGAFYAKHMLAGDRRVWRYCYWEYRNGLRALLVNSLNLSRARLELRALADYARGAIRFWRMRHSFGSKPEAIID